MTVSAKAVIALVVVVCFFTTIVAWSDVRWSPAWTWALRLVPPVIGLGALVLVCWAQWRKDKVPDFLRRVTKTYFDRRGFCFSVGAKVRDDTCLLQIVYQNRYERRCEARVVLKPSVGFFLTRKKVRNMALDIECGPAAFGLAQIPFPVPEKYQGQTVSFDVGAAVRYPEGRGKMLRYREGLTVGTAKFSSYGGQALTLAGLFVGAAIISRAARATVLLPVGVKEELPEDTPVEIEALWKLGDPQDVAVEF